MIHERILISRTDSIGDVILTLPLCAWLKKKYPNATILFLGKGYTLPIIKSYSCIDECIDWNDFTNLPIALRIDAFRKLNIDAIVHVFPNKEIATLAKKAKIPMRIGTSHRSFHLLTCNHRPNFSRKRSDKHEAVLNHELLRPLGLTELPDLKEILATTSFFQPKKTELPIEVQSFVEKNEGYVILHPKSQGSALEWPMEKYIALTNELIALKIPVIFTGTASEGEQFKALIPEHSLVLDSTGLLTLEQLITVIIGAKSIVACSTGPLHIGATAGIQAIGLFSSRRPIHPGRWSPIGVNAQAVVYDADCPTCKQGKVCKCIEKIEVERIRDVITTV